LQWLLQFAFDSVLHCVAQSLSLTVLPPSVSIIDKLSVTERLSCRPEVFCNEMGCSCNAWQLAWHPHTQQSFKAQHSMRRLMAAAVCSAALSRCSATCCPQTVTNWPSGQRHQPVHILLFVTCFCTPRLSTQPAHKATPSPGGTCTKHQPQPQVHLGLLEAGRGPASAGSSSSSSSSSSALSRQQQPTATDAAALGVHFVYGCTLRSRHSRHTEHPQGSPALCVYKAVCTKQHPTLHAAAHLLAQARVTSGLSSHGRPGAHLWLNTHDTKHLQAAAERHAVQNDNLS
jgi:hypothetical protein